MSQVNSIINKVIRGSKDKPILLDLFYTDNAVLMPLIIFVHGFKGFKDWGHFNLMADHFAQREIAFLKFNFSYNGTTPDHPTDFADLEAFGNNNYITELDDLGTVIDWVLSSEVPEGIIDKNKVYLVGHSRGGGICVLKAAEDVRVKKLVTWAAVSDFIGRNKESTVKEWKNNGVIYTYNSRTHQNMPLYYQLYETTQANKKRLNILVRATEIVAPSLIIHGTGDEAVSYKDANEIHNAISGSSLLLIEAAGHTFEVKHPFNEQSFPANASKVIDATIDFLRG